MFNQYTPQDILNDTRDKYGEWMEQYESLGLNPEVIVSTMLSKMVYDLIQKVRLMEIRTEVKLWDSNAS